MQYEKSLLKNDIKNPQQLIETPACSRMDFYNLSLEAAGTYEATVFLNSVIPCSRVRFSLSSQVNSEVGAPMIAVYSTEMNQYIGCLKNKVAVQAGADFFYSDPSEPSDGITFYYPNKIYISGSSRLLFRLFDGSMPDATTNAVVCLTVEYFS